MNIVVVPVNDLIYAIYLLSDSEACRSEYFCLVIYYKNF